MIFSKKISFIYPIIISLFLLCSCAKMETQDMETQHNGEKDIADTLDSEKKEEKKKFNLFKKKDKEKEKDVDLLEYKYEIVINEFSLYYKTEDEQNDLKLQKAELEEMDLKIRDLLKKNSQLEGLKHIALNSSVALERRANNDMNTAIKIMESLGFYAGKADYSINKESEPFLVTLTLSPGNQYSIGDIKITYSQPDEISNVFKDVTKHVGLFKKEVKAFNYEFQNILDFSDTNERAEAAHILDTINVLNYPLQNNGFPNARVISSGFAVNKNTQKLNGTVFINQGMPALMGDVEVIGNEKVSTKFIKSLIPWEQGEIWSDAKILEYRDLLQQAGLFQEIEISYDKNAYNEYRKKVQPYRKYLQALKRIAEAKKFERKINKEDLELTAKAKTMPKPVALPITLTVSESTSKTITGSAFYSTDQGFGTKAAWEHRNFFGNGERVRLELPLTKDESYISAEYMKKAFLHNNQDLHIVMAGGYENTDSYEQNFIESGIGIERDFEKEWLLSNYIYFNLVEPKNYNDDKNYVVFRLENSLQYDKRNNKDNPSKGYMAKIKFSPLLGTDDEYFYSLATELEGTFYHKILDKVILVTRLGFGFMPGSPENRIPRAEKFFLGGNNTVRGYAYQELGRHDGEDNPTGGLSYNYFNFESRYELTKELSIIPFIDAGMTYDERSPRFGEDMAYGAGIGARYATPVGPIRLDLAFPLNDPDNILDKKWSDFQIYVSIGQAF